MEPRAVSDFVKAMLYFGVAIGLALAAAGWGLWALCSHLRIGWHP